MRRIRMLLVLKTDGIVMACRMFVKQERFIFETGCSNVAEEVTMCNQECALYGELVRHLRDRCIERIAELDPTGGKDAAQAWVNQVIRDWFFTPQKDLHGDTPRDVIWREQKGEPNIVPKEHEHEMFFDDCPICQAMKELDVGEWQWYYDDGGYPLVAEYDPEGWDARWAEDKATFEKGLDTNESNHNPNLPIEDSPDFSKN